MEQRDVLSKAFTVNSVQRRSAPSQSTIPPRAESHETKTSASLCQNHFGKNTHSKKHGTGIYQKHASPGSRVPAAAAADTATAAGAIASATV